MKPLLVFSHANGFGASTYAKFFERLSADFDVAAVERYGHDPRFPVTNNWPHLVHELHQFLTAKLAARGQQKAFLVGHSLGGFLGLMESYAYPDLVRGVVMMDSPIISGLGTYTWKAMKLTGVDERVSPARFAKVRRTEWDSLDQVRAHFASKKLFETWDKDMLEDYCVHGTVPIDPAQPNGARRLAFSREVEYAIFRGFPDHLGPFTRRPCPVPMGFIGGTESFELKAVGDKRVRKLAGEHFCRIEGGHLFPMERPLEAARALTSLLRDLTSDA